MPNSLKVTIAKGQAQIDDTGHLTLTFSKKFEANKFGDQPDGRQRRQKLLAAITAAGFDCPTIDVDQTLLADKTGPEAPTKASVEGTLAQVNTIFGPEDS